MKVKCKKKAPRTDPATNPGDKGLTSEIPEDILSIMQETENVLFNGAKIPHGISHPVIRIENGKYYLAAFAYVYNKTNLEEHTLYRPSRWITMDLESGETVEINVCEQKRDC